MDTRFWGPSGWQLLHLISFAYKPDRDKTAICEFFTLLPYVLPCKFCRYSLSEYYEEESIEGHCATPLRLQKWLWNLHNKVNEKLRKQGLASKDHPYKNIPFEKVQSIYTNRLEEGCAQTHFPGWEFLFSIAENHPLSKEARASIPIKDAPPLSELKTDFEQNKWNVLSPEDRLPYYQKFLELIPNVLPFEEWRKVWKQTASECATTCWDTKQTTLRSLWKLRCALEKKLDLINTTDYFSLCRTLRNVKSGCSTSSRSKTCRKRKRGTK
jgi:hypothetical protein